MRFGPRDWAQRDPGRVAVRFGDAVTTYAALDGQANRIAGLFRSLGLRRGDHVAICMGNDPLVFALVWGAYRAGLYLTPASSLSSPGEAAAIVENATARAVIVDGRIDGLGTAVREAVGKAAGTSPAWFSVGADIAGFVDLGAALEAQSPDPIPDESPGGLMMYTSGTTGSPRGVIRPLPTEADGPPPFAKDLLQLFGMDAETRYLSTQPLYHAAALRFGLAVTAAGGTVELMPRFDAAMALDMLESRAITHSQWVPTMFGRLLALPQERRAAHRAPCHRVAIHGAAPCPIPVKRAMIDWWGPILLEYYSGTEGVGLTRIGSQEWLERPGSVGRCVKGTIHVVDADGHELPAGRTGRIFFSGVAPFAYFGDPGKTKARMSPQGWQGFGDIGHVDADGYLTLTDREDDLIISGGVNVYPQVVEAALHACPLVADCAVAGVDDADLGQRVVAFVVLKDGGTSGQDAVAALQAHAGAHLGRTNRPREYRFVAELPRTPTGKLQRRRLVS